MRQTIISLIVLLGTWTALASAQDKQAPGIQAPTEQTKNEVETAIDDSKKRGERVIGRCLQDCEESANSTQQDKSVATQILKLPKPAYPPIARAAHVSGVVNVQVLIDVNGEVIAAAAISGHPLLQAACVSAAREARFGPTLLEDEPVRVTGIIRYTFNEQ